MTIRSQKDLELELSKLKDFTNPSFTLEQYSTPAHIAAEWIWSLAMKREVVGKTILDAACGPGILGLGLLLMGAHKLYFIDKDKRAIYLCMENYQKCKKEYEIGEAEFILQDISLFDEHVDLVVQNPPFGTKEKHLDKKFLEKAFQTASVVYSMHKWVTKPFVETIARDHEFCITDVWRYDFPIKATFSFHEKPVKNVDVGLWRLEKINP